MALFGKKKNTENKEIKSEAKAKLSSRDFSHVLLQPRVTEKATVVSENASVYVFDVFADATARDVHEAVKVFYKETPTKVNMVKVPSKKVFARGKRGVKSGGKKAYVYFKKGTTIEVI